MEWGGVDCAIVVAQECTAGCTTEPVQVRPPQHLIVHGGQGGIESGEFLGMGLIVFIQQSF